MVQWQLSTLDHLMNSQFGRPFPRHGLQLLFWFANNCVTCVHVNFVDVLMLVSDCQPENGSYGFHRFGNVEKLLPVLNRKHKNKKQVAYFEVGNLNTESHPASVNLPAYVRENYGPNGNSSIYNIDRIIIRYQMGSRVVEAVYVTQHDGVSFGGFRPDGTHGVSPELIRALQNPQLDLSGFLSQMGYYGGMQTVREVSASAEQLMDLLQTYNGSTDQSDYFRFLSEAYSQQPGVSVQPYSYDQQVHYIHNYWEEQHHRPTPLRDWKFSWQWPFKASNENTEKGSSGGGGGIGGGGGLLKILLGVGALCLAARCLLSWWLRKADVNQNVLTTTPRISSYHMMLDYVF